MTRIFLAIAFGLLLPCLLAATPAPMIAPPYRVIVHPRNSTSSLDNHFVADAFLKKTTRWRDGEVIRPVDLGVESSVRRKFSQDVLGRSVLAVRSYWQQLIFSGRDVPPPELDSEAAVVMYVMKHPGAIGYIGGTGDVGGAKVVSIK